MKTGHAAPMGLCLSFLSFAINIPLLAELPTPHFRKR